MTNLSNETWFRDPALQRLFALLNADGGEARVAGGAVRNSLMDLPVADIDMATTLEPQTVMDRAKAAGIKAVPTGIDHGTVTLVLDGKGFEVTTLRRDVETDGRRAKVAFGRNWQEDAERRDLTINALYVGKDGEVIDLVGGLPDIETRTIRFIGDADMRIAEDYLRILRFFRFFAHYGGGRPDAAGLKACSRAKDKLSTLSAERVWSETKKLLSARDPGRALLWMRQSGVLGAILPETEKWGIDAIPALVAAEQALGWEPEAMLRLAAIVPKDAERLAALAQRLRLSNAEAAFLDHFARTPRIKDDVTDAAFDRDLYRIGKEGMIAVLKIDFALARANAQFDGKAMAKAGRLSVLLKRAEKFTQPVFPLSGADVLAAGIVPGPKVGETLKQLEAVWVGSNFTFDRAKLLARLGDLLSK
ncbi:MULTISPECIES: CCA tRNA nucleotidyltransferase [Alphaproteobacteria]|uniref:Poly(A) polymerase n=2 Tax=Alphaproteobacteria TaxID=28211 RepID=A0A512HF22_9HYPH|nr:MULTISPECIES: CCA tRNA nucleotidyltransferase [Alphaproteobacteria]GEO83960.1 poly(A) polymerase [Ciceribacter naphthalenivorans]GLR21162.1 poly(A) polymerase [Ciceribacter naphthalenivorans]GLT04018.1 poly(A) polymerase [Sphingomonas psychrolutea]